MGNAYITKFSLFTLYGSFIYKLFEEWVATLNEIDRRFIAERACKWFHWVSTWFPPIMKLLVDENEGGPLAVSLAALFEFLASKHVILFQEYRFNWGEPTLNVTRKRKIFGPLFSKRLWCPRTAEIAVTEFNVSTLLSVLLWGRCSTTRDHRAYTNKCCNALQARTLKTGTHVSQQCECTLAEVDVRHICKIIEDDKVPILGVRLTEGAEIEFEIKPFEPGDKYCAMSHVWGDCFASMDVNAIHQCQILRILRLLKNRVSNFPSEFVSENILKQAAETFTEGYIWMDSLCIPLDPIHEDLRNKAILRMKQTYQQATSVLVLDADMLSLSPDLDMRETVVQLVLSGWMQRLWTLQEAVFNDNVFIGNEDGFAFHLRLLLWKLASDEGPGIKYPWNWSVFTKALAALVEPGGWVQGPSGGRNGYHVEVLRDGAFAQRTGSVDFALHEFRNRTTSRAGDEAICLASFF